MDIIVWRQSQEEEASQHAAGRVCQRDLRGLSVMGALGPVHLESPQKSRHLSVTSRFWCRPGSIAVVEEETQPAPGEPLELPVGTQRGVPLGAWGSVRPASIVSG